MKPMRPVAAGDVGPQRLPFATWIAIVLFLVALTGIVFLVVSFLYWGSLNILWQ